MEDDNKTTEDIKGKIKLTIIILFKKLLRSLV